MHGPDRPVSLRLHAHAGLIPLLQAVVEQGAGAFGLEYDKTLRLTMAAEELLSHLVETAPGTEINLTLEPGGWCVRADMAFVSDPSELWAMNLVAGEDVGGDRDMARLGLLLASRMVDDFTVRLEGRVVHLALHQNRNYPVIEAGQGRRVPARGTVTVVENPEPALIKEACARACGLYPLHSVHPAFSTPGKVVDMAARGDLVTVVAVDETSAPVGLLCRRSPSEKSVAFYGPYLLAEGGSVAEVLEDHLLHSVARTGAVGLFSDLATDDLTIRNYESLGRLHYLGPDGEMAERDVWYRHLREDMGTTVWAHPRMVPFIEEACERLVLMRDVRQTDGVGETLPARSVFSSRLRPDLHEATLTPMVTGADVAEAVARHVEVLRREDYRIISFRLDLAYGREAAVGGALMDNGFVPRLLLPYAGKSDVVVFQHVAS
ncbi:hypothetical protein N1030_03830 [Desulfovibrio mangrovi]|uniref:hypothetical protein n=1 Tax=Desulfovibrio mangrovi TaxID=2976983 RepID=UPI00224715DF|nr:hypothetical protein [Desulfovibrio mangrovi]UZP68116.1 hypothetical protein N1030_03830 [Desulfovibrio mangrovi]